MAFRSYNRTRNISIHALRVEGDIGGGWLPLAACSFLSTPSVWRATVAWLMLTLTVNISIHALRVEGDLAHLSRGMYPWLFLSTPSVWRATCVKPSYFTHGYIFLSTPSVWRATSPHEGYTLDVIKISIHALRVEGDVLRTAKHPSFSDFYPRPPCGGRPGDRLHRYRCVYFYPRPPCGGRRITSKQLKRLSTIFLSTPSVWRATEGAEHTDLF